MINLSLKSIKTYIMDKTKFEHLRFPIGRFKAPEQYTDTLINQYIEEIAALPRQMKAVTEPLSDEQLDTSYRPEGWTLRQVIHHVADSHLNSYIRFKWTLTEDSPLIKTYSQKDWAMLPEAKSAPISISLDILESLHKRWVLMLKNIDAEDRKREFIHPETNRPFSLNLAIALYAWHGRHHVAQIESLKKEKGW